MTSSRDNLEARALHAIARLSIIAEASAPTLDGKTASTKPGSKPPPWPGQPAHAHLLDPRQRPLEHRAIPAPARLVQLSRQHDHPLPPPGRPPLDRRRLVARRPERLPGPAANVRHPNVSSPRRHCALRLPVMPRGAPRRNGRPPAP